MTKVSTEHLRDAHAALDIRIIDRLGSIRQRRASHAGLMGEDAPAHPITHRAAKRESAAAAKGRRKIERLTHDLRAYCSQRMDMGKDDPQAQRDIGQCRQRDQYPVGPQHRLALAAKYQGRGQREQRGAEPGRDV